MRDDSSLDILRNSIIRSLENSRERCRSQVKIDKNYLSGIDNKNFNSFLERNLNCVSESTYPKQTLPEIQNEEESRCNSKDANLINRNHCVEKPDKPRVQNLSDSFYFSYENENERSLVSNDCFDSKKDGETFQENDSFMSMKDDHFSHENDFNTSIKADEMSHENDFLDITTIFDEKVRTERRNSDIESGSNCLKLAVRSSNHAIFEDCSTYSIACQEIHPTNKTAKTDEESNSPRENSILDEDTQKSSGVKEDIQTPVLRDTVFSYIINGESAPDDNIPEQTTSTSNKIRRRKKSKKGKKKTDEPFVYDCPKCGVSYVLKSKLLDEVACCLHCDLWTSVEPVFMRKTERLPWNTCCLC